MEEFGNALQERRCSAAVPKITALLVTHNDADRIGRALDSLRPCDEVLVIDDRSQDRTRNLAHAHGAIVKEARTGVPLQAHLAEARHDWILLIHSTEAVSEALEAALFLWKDTDPGLTSGFLIGIREETESGWKTCPPQMRLVNRHRIAWANDLPVTDPPARALPGDLLRFSFP